jgi:hypothetical protein
MHSDPNGEIRDLLPEFVHDRLPPAEAARVREQIAASDELRAEAELVRALGDALPTPRVDVGRISAGVIAQTIRPAAGVTPISAARQTSRRWLRAAALLVMVGSASAVIVQRAFGPGGGVDSAPDAGRSTVSAELALTTDVSDLADADLAALEQAVASLEAAPASDAEQTNTDWAVSVDGGTR